MARTETLPTAAPRRARAERRGPKLSVETVGIVLLAAGALLWPLFTPKVAHFYGTLSVIYALVGSVAGDPGRLDRADLPGPRRVPRVRLLRRRRNCSATACRCVLAVPIIGLVGAGISLVLGVPSLRLRGVYLTITTLAFGVACQRYFFTRPQLRGSTPPRCPARACWASRPTSDRGLYYAVLVVLAIALLLAWNIRRTDTGRVLFAIRDSEQAAAAMAIRIAPYKIGVFAASAALATRRRAVLRDAVPGHAGRGPVRRAAVAVLPGDAGARRRRGDPRRGDRRLVPGHRAAAW